ncbi:MAG: hypothetical protein JNG85_10165 [Spirochaetaceae bacterium]|nr:hypothetical protein [Spirochaetaceae bacterium]
MRCEQFLDRYDRLDAGETPGYPLRRHLAACASCEAKVRRREAALAAYRAGSSDADAAKGNLLDERIMAAVRLTPRPRRAVLVRDWILSGFVIAASMVIIPLGSEFDRAKETFGFRLALPLSLVLGLALTAYMAVFIGSHMDSLLPLLRRMNGHAGGPHSGR